MSSVSAPHPTPLYDRTISLVDSIGLVLFLIVPVSRNGGTMITIKIDRNKIRRACETRYVENRRLSSPTIPPPALTPPCAGTSGDRPDLPADDWTAPSIAEPVAAAAIGLVAGSFSAAGAAMRSDCIVRQQAQNN